MKIVSNDKLIKRNNRLGQITSIASLVVLAVGMIYSFKDTEGKYLTLTFASFIVGLILFQVGNFFLNKWGKSPRPDEKISQSLKGLDDKYTLYHYSTDISHLLVGPAGVIAILPYSQGGKLYYDVKRKDWRQHGGNFLLKAFAQEGLGRPISEAEYTKGLMEKYLSKIGISPERVDDSVLFVFSNDKATIEGEGSPIPYVTTEKIKDYIRKQTKEINFDPDTVIAAIQKKIK
jgi:hypothetical protein